MYHYVVMSVYVFAFLFASRNMTVTPCSLLAWSSAVLVQSYTGSTWSKSHRNYSQSSTTLSSAPIHGVTGCWEIRKKVSMRNSVMHSRSNLLSMFFSYFLLFTYCLNFTHTYTSQANKPWREGRVVLWTKNEECYSQCKLCEWWSCMDADTRAIIKVKGHQNRWLGVGYDLEIGHV